MAEHFESVHARKFYQLNMWQLHRTPIWNVIDYFKPDEFDYGARVHPLLLIMLDNARWEASRLAGDAVRFTVTSDHRPGDDKTHGEDPCLGVDLHAHSSASRFYIVQGLLAAGFTRVGIYCDDHHIHADIGNVIMSEKYPSNVMWVRDCPRPGAL
jgi:hypothetical protein